METSYMDLGIAAQDNVLSAMETSKSFMIESMKAFTSTTKKMLPDMSAMPGMGAFGDMVPNPMSTVTMTYDFAEKVLASQRSFMEDMVEALVPAPA